MHDFCAQTLRYTAPSHGDWGLVRIVSLLPESHIMFVCPAACGRHGALGAVDKGYKNRVAYVYVDRSDIIAGYDSCIFDGVAQTLSMLPKRPKCFMVYVSCLDNLIGTDMDAVITELNAKYPDIKFNYGRMNPISLEGSTPPAVSTTDAMFGFLEPAAKEADSLNMLGNFVDKDHEGELYAFLKSCGINTARHLSHYSTFDAYMEMARSAYNLVLSPIAKYAAANLQAKHNTPFLFIPATYDTDEIAENYSKILAFIGSAASYDFNADIAETERAIETAKAALSGRPVSISSEAVIKPFTLARFLLKRGFNIASVVTEEVVTFDADAYDDVKNQVEIINPLGTDVIDFKHRRPEVVAIGYDAAYITGSSHIVNLQGDQGLFGYHGTQTLMRLLAEAAMVKSDLKALMDEYGLVV
jgi:nitrogenase molybdenum-iron protein alpha/beta subunit